jgi:hypothetical protein
MRAANAAIFRKPHEVIPSSSDTSLICIALPAPSTKGDRSDGTFDAHPLAPSLDVCSTVACVGDRRELVEDAAVAGAVAAVLSGVPSTAHAILTRIDPLEASMAAGTLLLPREHRRSRLLPAAMLAHGALSFGWAVVLALVLPQRRTVAWSLPAGLAIAALDLGIVGRRIERIRALATAPQVLDHLAYAATVGAVLSRRRARRRPAA